MILYLRLLIVVSLLQLTWWKAIRTPIGADAVNVMVFGTALLACLLSLSGRPIGCWIGALQGLGYLAVLLAQNHLDTAWNGLPLGVWSSALVVFAGVHLWLSREPRVGERPRYERMTS